MGDQADAVDGAEERRLQATPREEPGDIGDRPDQPGEKRPARRRSGMALVEPSSSGPVAGDHPQEPDQALAVAVRDHGARAVLHRPSGDPEAPRQVDVAARADALDEAAERLERG